MLQDNQTNQPTSSQSSSTMPQETNMVEEKKSTHKTTKQDKKKKDDEEIEKLKQEIIALKNELEQMTNTAKRALADLQNFKRREEENKKQMMEFANVILVNDLLDALNNFSHASKHIPDELKNQQWTEGILHIHRHLLASLEKHGLKEISSVGQKLDPYKHEAVMQGQGEKDIIIEEFEKGYMLGDKIIRPAKVKVGNGKVGNGEDQKNSSMTV